MRTSDDEKQKIADLLFEEGRAIHRLANLRKGNSAPDYNGDGLMERAERTVSARAARYASAVRGLVDEPR